MTWEIKCDVCGRSSLDGKADDGAGDRCSACGQFPALESFTCPACRMRSYNPSDIAFGYCGNCHDFTGATR